MKKEIVMDIINEIKNTNGICNFIIYTDIAAGRGINGVSYRTFYSNGKPQIDEVIFEKDYLIIRYGNSKNYIEYKNITMIHTFLGNDYNYEETGLR